jgi:hypothetical protein
VTAVVRTPFSGKPHDEFHRHSTNYHETDRNVLVKLDTGVVKSALPHRAPIDFGDKTGLCVDACLLELKFMSICFRSARVLVWGLRKLTSAFYRQKYIHYACVFETLAAVPGMVAGMLQHLSALRRMEHNTMIKKLLDEAENERMHLMTFMEMSRPCTRSFLCPISVRSLIWVL